MVPIIIICYNNYKYVQNTVNQIYKINQEYLKYIQILDNFSTCQDTINYLKNVNCKVIYNKTNNGPWITHKYNQYIYNSLPDKFIVTDPDLEFNKNLPNNFIEILLHFSDVYNSMKIGFALDINIDVNDLVICIDNEKKYWDLKINIQNEGYEIYDAAIDTTFCLINKHGYNGEMRIAGNFTAKHLPWYKSNKIYNIYENYLLNTDINLDKLISSNSNNIINFINKDFIKVYKNDEFFFISNDDINLNFWKNDFNNYKKETFKILDKYLDKNKNFIDIGSYIGTTCMYATRKSKHVYCIEDDNININCKNNCKNNNYTLINNININQTKISLIKVDINGNEEKLLEELFKKYNNIPIYISFNYSNWKDKNLDRFEFLTEDHKIELKANPNVSILFIK